MLACVRDWLTHARHTVVMTREPGGTALGERVREILLHAREIDIDPDTEVLLMFAARSQHLSRVVGPALASGKTVLCDRFTDATYAYQGGGQSVPVERIATLENWVQGTLRPDLTLLFDVPVETGLRRAAERNNVPDRFESRDRDYLERVRRTYLDRAEREPRRIRIIDAARPVSEVRQQVESVLEEFFRASR